MLKHLRDMDKNDLLEALGLEERKSGVANLLPVIGAAAAGIIIGAAVGFLLAPKAGRDLRTDIGEKFRGVRDRVKGGAMDDTPTSETGLPENGRQI